MNYGIKITKPWSKEMYDHIDMVSQLMKLEIIKSIVNFQNDFDKLNELMVLCGGIKYGDSYDIEELKEDFRIRNQITPDKHMARLNQLGRKAESEKMIGVAVNAEVYRGKMAGYYVEKKLIANQTIEELSEEQLEDKMRKLADTFELIERNPNDKK